MTSLEYTNVIEVFDFRAGIIASFKDNFIWGATTNEFYPIQTASPATWNCCADPNSGALKPLPINYPIIEHDIDDISTILDAILINEIFDNSTKSYTSSLFVAEKIYYYSSFHIIIRIRQYKNIEQRISNIISGNSYNYLIPPPTDIAFLAFPHTFDTQDVNAQLAVGRTTSNINNCSPENLRPVVAYKVNSRQFPLTGTIPTNLQNLSFIDYSVCGNIFSPYSGMYPDPVNPTVPSTVPTYFNTILGYGFLLSHQGRLIYVNNYKFYPFNGPNQLVNTDIIHFTDSLKWNVIGGDLIVDEANFSGFGTGCSFNANSLFLVRRDGGAVSIRGSLNNPQVVKLPAVEPTGFFRPESKNGVMTPMGFTYLSNSGVWVYQDNTDSSKLISLQIDPTFHETYDKGRMISDKDSVKLGYKFPWVWASNFYIYDIRTQSWWTWKPTEFIKDDLNQTDVIYDSQDWHAQFFIPYKNGVIALPSNRSQAIHTFRYFDYQRPSGVWRWHSNTTVFNEKTVTPIKVQIFANCTQYWNDQDAVVIFEVLGNDENGNQIFDLIRFDITPSVMEWYENQIVLNGSFSGANKYTSFSIRISSLREKNDESNLRVDAPSVNGFRLFVSEEAYHGPSDFPSTISSGPVTENLFWDEDPLLSIL